MQIKPAAASLNIYLTAVMVAALTWAGEALVILEGIGITTMVREALDMFLKEAGHNYNSYKLVSR